MILPAARLWYEGKSKELEDVLREAERFRLTGYARCVYPGSGQSFIILNQGAVREIQDIGPTNRPAPKTLRDLWGKSKIKEGLLQIFEIPPEAEYYLSRVASRQACPADSMKAVKQLVLEQRRQNDPSLVDIHTANGKGLLIFDNNAVALCYFSENEGFTLTGIEAFKKMAAIIAKSGRCQAFCSRLGSDPPPEATAWLPILMEGVDHSAPINNLKSRLVDRFGKHFPPGTVLFREGDEGHEVFIIVSGMVSIYKGSGTIRKILAELGPDEFFGEMAIFNKAPRTATAETTEESLIVTISRDHFRTLLFNSYDFRINLVKKLAKRLKDTVDEMVKLWEDPRAIYLEKIIFQIMHTDQKWQEEGIPPGLLVQEIANYSGMRLSEIDTVFRRLLDSGKVQFIRGKVVMKEIASLP